jgi:hypothetical protein
MQRSRLRQFATLFFFGGFPLVPWAHGTTPTIAPAAALTATNALAEGVTELTLRELYQMPIGPRGLVPSTKLLALDGKQVRIAGYMVGEDEPVAGRLILAPMPMQLVDEDEPESDDLPPNVVYVNFPSSIQAHSMRGQIRLTGTLRLGAVAQPDGRLAAVRLELSPELVLHLTAAAPTATKTSR